MSIQRKMARFIAISFMSLLLVSCGADNSSPPPPTATTKFAFVTNFTSGTISTFAVDPQTPAPFQRSLWIPKRVS
jgi:hypothetical protein